MTNDLTIQAAETGRLRLFAVNLDAKAVAELDNAEPEALGLMLGVDDLDPTYIELVRIEDLSELGLMGYLREGYDLGDDVLGADRTKLAALRGHVLIVLSLAFQGHAVTLPKRADLTLIATYNTHGPDWSEGMALNTPSAEPYSGPPAKKRPSDAAMSGRVATFALLFIFIFTAVFIWIAA
jgi:hypothetical protein